VSNAQGSNPAGGAPSEVVLLVVESLIHGSRFEFSRRALSSRAPARLLAAMPHSTCPPASRRAQAQGAPVNQAPGFYRYKIGDITLTAINDGFGQAAPLEGFVRNAELADVKKAMEQAYPSEPMRSTITFTTLAHRRAAAS
jgi:hypothetical protein